MGGRCPKLQPRSCLDRDAMIRLTRLALLLTIGLLAGCSAAGAAPLPVLPVGAERPVVPRAYPEGGITIAAPDSKTAKIDAVRAYAVCSNGEASCPDGAPGSAELASATDDQYGDIKPDGTVSHPIQARLTWVFTWNHVSCPARLGPKLPGAVSAPPAVCDWVVLVDADSGQFLITYAGPPAK